MAGGMGGYSGGAGGTGYDGQDGADGARGARNSGGGGGGAGGGMGGAGSGGAAGGAGGTAASPNGKPGTDGRNGGISSTSGGGGGGGYNGNGSGSALADNTGPLTGGYGGYGGRGGYGPDRSGSASGGGGAGGYGAVATDASGTVVTNRFAISGGPGGVAPFSYGPAHGGDGGVGVFFVNTGVTLNNIAEIKGGAGGGTVRRTDGGAGGAGIVGSGITINNSGKILGGDTFGGGSGGTGVRGSNISISNSGTIEGGSGYGGAGVIDTGGGTIRNSGTIEMGDGFATRPARVAIEGTDLTIVNTGMIGRRDGDSGLSRTNFGITGAHLTIKNVGGTIRGCDGTNGLGSAGISGSDLKIVNTGTIEGGFARGTSAREADAIDFTGGLNRLTLGGTFGGALSVVGELKLLTDGAAMLAVAIRGSGNVEIAGDVTLSHASSYIGATTIDAEDTLTLAARVSIASSAIADNGTLRLAGNTLQGSVTGSGFVKGAGALTGADTGGELRVAANGGTFTFTGAGDTFAGNLGGSGSIDFAGGSDTLEAGLALNVATLDLSGAEVSLAANQRFSHKLEASGGTLDLGGYKLTSTHATSLAGISIEGAGSLVLRRRTNVTADTSLTARLVDLGAITQTADLTFTDRGYLTVGQNATDILAGDVGVFSARSILNAGTIEKTAGDGTSTLAGAVENSGTISVASGTLAITDAVSGTGLLEIEGHSTMELASLIAAGQSVDFSVGHSRLQLDDAVAFEGSISGFGGGDAITLSKFDRMSQVLYEAARGGGGTLSVSDGARMFSTHLDGTYTASGFKLTHTAGGESIHYKA